MFEHLPEHFPCFERKSTYRGILSAQSLDERDVDLYLGQTK